MGSWFVCFLCFCFWLDSFLFSLFSSPFLDTERANSLFIFLIFYSTLSFSYFILLFNYLVFFPSSLFSLFHQVLSASRPKHICDLASYSSFFILKFLFFILLVFFSSSKMTRWRTLPQKKELKRNDRQRFIHTDINKVSELDLKPWL